MNALAVSLIPDPIKDIEKAIDPLYDFRKYGIDSGLSLFEKKKRKRESPEYLDDRLHAWDKVQTWKEKLTKFRAHHDRKSVRNVGNEVGNISALN